MLISPILIVNNILALFTGYSIDFGTVLEGTCFHANLFRNVSQWENAFKNDSIIESACG
jgi:hypothetical protein